MIIGPIPLTGVGLLFLFYPFPYHGSAGSGERSDKGTTGDISISYGPDVVQGFGVLMLLIAICLFFVAWKIKKSDAQRMTRR